MTPKETQERIESGMKARRDLLNHWMSIAQPIRVLVVDDDKDFCVLLSSHITKLLERHCVIQQAFSGVEALNILDRQPIDILFLDLRMPNLDGLGVLQAMPKGCHEMIVLLVTGFANDSAEIVKAREMGYTIVLRKTELLDDLQAIFPFSCSTCVKK